MSGTSSPPNLPKATSMSHTILDAGDAHIHSNATTLQLTEMTETAPQLQSRLYRMLPKGIRELIYEYALGNEQRSFHFDDLLVMAFPMTFFTVQGLVRGMPIWLLVSKSICLEAIDTFSRTRYVTPHLRGEPVPSSRNPLVFHNGSIRNISLQYPYISPKTPESGTAEGAVHPLPARMFLKVFTPYFTEHPTLKKPWSPYQFDEEAEVSGFTNWQKKWYSRFQRVDLRLFTQDIDTTLMKESAEGVAQGLVFGDTNVAICVTWEEERRQRFCRPTDGTVA